MTRLFKLGIECENVAFEGEFEAREVARLLREAADRVERGDVGTDGPIPSRNLFDINGNKVGFFVFRGEK